MLLGGMWDHPRVLGRPGRGVALLLVAAIFTVLSARCLAHLSQYESGETFWTAAAVVTIGVVCLAGALGVHEIGRPIWMVAGRPRSRRLRGAEIRWSTKYPDLVAGYGRITEMYNGYLNWAGMLVAAARSNNLRIEIAFDDPPLQIGRRARVTMRVSVGGGDLPAAQIGFRLRCLRESDPGGVELQSRMESLADLRPRRIGRRSDRSGTDFTLDFDLPPGLPGSDLLAPQPVYWELTVNIDGLAQPCEERFFVPVEA